MMKHLECLDRHITQYEQAIEDLLITRCKLDSCLRKLPQLRGRNRACHQAMCLTVGVRFAQDCARHSAACALAASASSPDSGQAFPVIHLGEGQFPTLQPRLCRLVMLEFLADFGNFLCGWDELSFARVSALIFFVTVMG